MALQGLGSVATTPSDDSSKKVRKPYTITKPRDSWTEQEHDKFLEAVQLFDRDWKKIEVFVGPKTVIQIRSHAQKYFLKVQKNGTSEHVPPPRPKRKAAHPYPQKAFKNEKEKVIQFYLHDFAARLPPNGNVAFRSSSSHPEPGYVLQANLSPILRNSRTTAAVHSWTNTIPTASSSHTSKEDTRAGGSSVTYVCSSSSKDSSSKHWAAHDVVEHGNKCAPLQDFIVDEKSHYQFNQPRI